MMSDPPADPHRRPTDHTGREKAYPPTKQWVREKWGADASGEKKLAVDAAHNIY
jgi:hypothetical protein